eukprot:Stramenopile-MAST_4_protein_293
MGNEQSARSKKAFKGQGNTLGTAADSRAAAQAAALAARGHGELQKRQPGTQHDKNMRSAALAAAESRANKFDNLVKEKKKARKEKLQTSLGTGGTAKNSFAAQGLAGVIKPTEAIDLGFDPTQTVMSSSSTGRAIQSKVKNGDLCANTHHDIFRPEPQTGSTSGGSMFDSSIGSQHQPVDHDELSKVLKFTQTSSIAVRNERFGTPSETAATAPKIAVASKSVNNGNESKFCTPIEIENAMVRFKQAKVESADPDMAIAFLFSGESTFEAVKAAETVKKVLQNIMKNPTEKKFQRLKLKNAAVSKKVLLVPGGSELLVAAGFMLEDESAGDDDCKIVLDVPEDGNVETIEPRLVSIVTTIDSFIDSHNQSVRNELAAAADKRAQHKFGAHR